MDSIITNDTHIHILLLYKSLFFPSNLHSCILLASVFYISLIGKCAKELSGGQVFEVFHLSGKPSASFTYFVLYKMPSLPTITG